MISFCIPNYQIIKDIFQPSRTIIFPNNRYKFYAKFNLNYKFKTVLNTSSLVDFSYSYILPYEKNFMSDICSKFLEKLKSWDAINHGLKSSCKITTFNRWSNMLTYVFSFLSFGIEKRVSHEKSFIGPFWLRTWDYVPPEIEKKYDRIQNNLTKME